MVNFDPSQDADASKKIDELWTKLSDGGTVLMELGEYPFSKRYGWCADKYGFSWQLILTDAAGEPRPRIMPSLLFVTDSGKKAEEATDMYLSVFKNATRGTIARYPAGSEPNVEGAVMFTDFMLENQWFTAMDGTTSMHKFGFNEAVSLLVKCDDQNEIDYYSEKLSAVPESEQCGWIKDAYGVSWQISPTVMNDMMSSSDKAAVDRVTQAFLKMKKFDLAAIQKAYDGK
jgi:predicted 3-demethylubiquinone-9 3-methyltransferase (glyoxalase superfamily)